MNDAIIDLPAENRRPPEYAGFWIRVAAYVLDFLLIYLAMIIIGFVLTMVGVTEAIFSNIYVNPRWYSDGWSQEFTVMVVLYSLVLLAILLYFPIMESSSKQATLGKMIVGVKVGDRNGNKISFANALGRFFSKIISGLILYIGYMMAGWTEKKQALHDMIADTYVFYKRG